MSRYYVTSTTPPGAWSLRDHNGDRGLAYFHQAQDAADAANALNNWTQEEPSPLPLFDMVAELPHGDTQEQRELGVTVARILSARCFTIEPNEEPGDNFTRTLAEIFDSGDSMTFDVAATLRPGESAIVGGGAAPSFTVTRQKDHDCQGCEDCTEDPNVSEGPPYDAATRTGMYDHD